MSTLLKLTFNQAHSPMLAHVSPWVRMDGEALPATPPTPTFDVEAHGHHDRTTPARTPDPGAPRRRRITPGRYTFTLDPAGEFCVGITIEHTSQTGVFARWLLVSRYRADGERIEHVASNAWPESDAHTLVSSLHARATVTGLVPSSAESAEGVARVIALDVDLTFLDVTRLVHGCGAPTLHRGSALLPTMIGNSLVRVYQCLAVSAANCHLVTVVVPPALHHAPRASQWDALVFFAPKAGEYRSAASFECFQPARYLLTGFNPDLHRPPAQWHTDGNHLRITHNPSCRFAGQLEASGRKVLLVLPASNGGAFSPFTNRTLTVGDHGPSLLDALVTAVYADVHGFATEHPPRAHAGRVGIAGFSFGGGAAIESFHANRTHVDDVMLFDPEHLDGRATRELRAWATQPDHRLRLVGGMHFRALRDLAHGVEGTLHANPLAATATPDVVASRSVLLWPARNDFYETAQDYVRALQRPDAPLLGWLDAPERGTTFSWLGTVLVPPDARHLHGTRLRCLRPAEPPPAPHDAPERHGRTPAPHHPESVLPRMAPHEAEFYFVGIAESQREDCFARGYEPAPHEVFRDARQVLERAQSNGTYPQAIRHQWTVMGGESDGPTADGSFRGYFFRCLVTSGLGR